VIGQYKLSVNVTAVSGQPKGNGQTLRIRGNTMRPVPVCAEYTVTYVTQVNGPTTGVVVKVITSTLTATSTLENGRIICVMVRASTCTPAQDCSMKASGEMASALGRERSVVLEVSSICLSH